MADLTGRLGNPPDYPWGRPQRLLLRVPEAAELCAIGRTRAYELVAAGVWPSVHIGRAVRIPQEGLLVWLEEQLAQADK